LEVQFTMPEKLHRRSAFLPSLSIKTIAIIDPAGKEKIIIINGAVKRQNA